MAGGVANIWGHLPRGRDSWLGSAPYERPGWIKTYASFFEHRFLNDMTQDAEITDGVCLKAPTARHYVFYKEDTAAIEMDLSKMAGEQQAVAVDAKKPYRELRLGRLAAGKTGLDGALPFRLGDRGGGNSSERTIGPLRRVPGCRP